MTARLLARTAAAAVCTALAAETASTWVCGCGAVNHRHANPFVCWSCGAMKGGK